MAKNNNNGPSWTSPTLQKVAAQVGFGLGAGAFMLSGGANVTDFIDFNHDQIGFRSIFDGRFEAYGPIEPTFESALKLINSGAQGAALLAGSAYFGEKVLRKVVPGLARPMSYIKEDDTEVHYGKLKRDDDVSKMLVWSGLGVGLSSIVFAGMNFSDMIDWNPLDDEASGTVRNFGEDDRYAIGPGLELGGRAIVSGLTGAVMLPGAYLASKNLANDVMRGYNFGIKPLVNGVGNAFNSAQRNQPTQRRVQKK